VTQQNPLTVEEDAFMRDKNFSLKRSGEETLGLLRIGVDLDGVVVDTVQKMAEMVRKRFSIDINQIMKKKRKVDYWLLNWPELKRIPGCVDFIAQKFKEPAVYQTAKPIKGAISILNKWAFIGHQIWLITARPKSLKLTTQNWLKSYGLERFSKEEKIIFHQLENEIDAEYKIQVVKNLRLHIFIEDNPKTLKKITAASIIRKILLSFPYNFGQETGQKTDLVKNWQEIDQIVEAASSLHRHRYHFYVAQY